MMDHSNSIYMYGLSPTEAPSGFVINMLPTTPILPPTIPITYPSLHHPYPSLIRNALIIPELVFENFRLWELGII